MVKDKLMLINRVYKNAFRIGLAVLLFVCSSVFLKAQQKSADVTCRALGPEDTARTPPEVRALPYCSPSEPVGCEVARVYLDSAVTIAREAGETSLIVIARLGDGEKSARLNWRRLKQVKNQLGRFDVEAVAASGERVKGRGRVDVYVSGKLLYALPYARNSDITCEFIGAIRTMPNNGMHPTANKHVFYARLGGRGVECAAGDAGRWALLIPNLR